MAKSKGKLPKWGKNASRIYYGGGPSEFDAALERGEITELLPSGQKFYTAYCLLAAATFDLAVAENLKLSRNYPWAVTAYYYSMVKSSQLLAFFAFNTYPTKHDKIPLLLNSQIPGRGDDDNDESKPSEKPLGARKINCDWVFHFLGYEGLKGKTNSSLITELRKFLPCDSDIEKKLDFFGSFLNFVR